MTLTFPFQTLTADVYGEAFLSSGMLDIWGNTPASVCTSNADYGCFRQGTGTNYLNPLQSARLRTVHSFNFKYGRVEAEAKLPKGDWLWPGRWTFNNRAKHNMGNKLCLRRRSKLKKSIQPKPFQIIGVKLYFLLEIDF